MLFSFAGFPAQNGMSVLSFIFPISTFSHWHDQTSVSPADTWEIAKIAPETARILEKLMHREWLLCFFFFGRSPNFVSFIRNKQMVTRHKSKLVAWGNWRYNAKLTDFLYFSNFPITFSIRSYMSCLPACSHISGGSTSPDWASRESPPFWAVPGIRLV